jgi:methyl-accepting chemotaxis protein
MASMVPAIGDPHRDLHPESWCEFVLIRHFSGYSAARTRRLLGRQPLVQALAAFTVYRCHRPSRGLTGATGHWLISQSLWVGSRVLTGLKLLAPRIVSVVVLLSLVAAGLGYAAISGLNQFNQRVLQIDRASARAIIGERINGMIYQVVMDSRGIYMSADRQESEKYAPLVLQGLAKIHDLADQWSALASISQAATMERAHARLNEFIQFRTELVRLSRQATLPEARAYGDNDANRSNRAALNTEIVALAADNDRSIQQLTDDIDRFYKGRLSLLITMAAVGIVASLALAVYVVVVTVTRPIRRLTAAMIALAGGRTDVTVPGVERHDEIGEMARAADVFLQRAIAVARLTAQIIENIRHVAVAATQASQAVSQVSDGSNVQLNSLRQSAAALDQSTQAIAHVAQSTQQASEGAKQTLGLSAQGITSMERMVEVVTTIAENSAQVRRIADSISRIANQTNMLSLNAAIEAARAGEQGRGFAVVAEEVGKLAQNTRSLAEDITTEAHRSTEEAAQGVTMARDVAANMKQIAKGVADGDRLIGDIATAMEEQQVVVANVNRNVNELTRIGQSNATAAEEITATMLDLSRLADTTRVSVDEFHRQAA